VAASTDDGTVGDEPDDTNARAGCPTSDSETGAVIPAAKPWAVYLLHCTGGKSYIGISPTPHERFEVHQAGKGAAFTRANPPQALAAIAWFENRGAAASMEARLKALPRPAKLAWFERFAATTSAAPATLEVGLASITSRRLISRRCRFL
jgi:putative endonuclease